MKIPFKLPRSSRLPKQARKVDRKRQTLPVKIRGDRAEAITRDISFSGVYFETASSFQIDSIIKMTIDLENPHGMQLECEATIVRVEDRGSKVGVGVRIDATTVVLKPR